MVQFCRQIYKHFFHSIEPAKETIFRSAGLIFVYLWLKREGILKLISESVLDNRSPGLVRFKLSEVLVFIILHLIDGDKRISHYDRNPNQSLFKRIFKWGANPVQSSVLKILKRNPALSKTASQMLLKIGINQAVQYCRNNNKRTLTIDVDQTAREIHGKQEKVGAGYWAGRKGALLYQIRVYAIRELKQTLQVKLLSGNSHSSTDFLAEIEYIANALKHAGIQAIFIGDSGFESGEVCDYLNENGFGFVFSVKQRQSVKLRGKNSKNKTMYEKGSIKIKESLRPVTNKFQYEYREIYIQVLSNDGQLWFEFAADKFTNILVTNLKTSKFDIYKKYRKHAIIETIIEELKNDFGAGLAHANSFEVNSTMTSMAGVAYNIKNQFIDAVGMAQKTRMKLSTFQNRWLHTPGEFAKKANRWILKISPQRFHEFCKLVVA